MIADRDLSRLETIVHPNAVFRSPMSHSAYTPRAALILALSTVITIFEDFKYHRELATDDGLSVVLEFSAKANGKSLKGIDLIRFDEDGKIVEFEVMVRPLSGLQALGGEMGKRLGDKLPAFKAKL
ncbi:hypothetical protein VHUM_03249 [Vanrija humicola]|uniref:SnoaL-like domain-containing protein n=1 Tax=Vanrija humicola TaxID=5417 RepID=A0A7D8V0T5_VANHU|nr:hypothetical protein VHUM_03249 [Vanrija humicola]